jgi:subtilase family serine protease
MLRNRAVQKFLAAFFVFLALPILASAQAANVQARITQPVDDTILAVLKGNTHPLARAEFDRGAAPAGMPLHRMLLSLKRSPAQESALQQLLIDLQDKSSLNYHKWLTPAQFGQQFGASDEDIQTITSWLGSHGFQVANVSSGRTVIEFSGTVGQVQQAFHTAIHKYVVNGEEHWANSSDPQIPTALVPVVAGPGTLHNFTKEPYVKLGQVATGVVKPGSRPNLTFQNQGQTEHAVAPADFAKIYNVPNLLLVPPAAQGFNGNNTTIGVVARSNINVADVQNFRSISGLDQGIAPFDQGNIFLNGPDPGDLGGNEELEAVLDASWSGTAAPGTFIKFVVSQSTEVTDGTDLSEVFIVDNDAADIMTESFGLCEENATQALANAELNLAQQAAAQGITFMASSGDSGAVCTVTSTKTIATSIPASLPFVLSVGGTMFTANDAAFWNSTNSATLESALSFIPEDVWNEMIPGSGQGAGGGGISTLFNTPPWQTGVTGLSGTKRQVPDVSFNAAVDHDSSFLCIASRGASCVPNAQGIFSFMTVGGTSVASPSFAGIMALVDEEISLNLSTSQQRQGEAGYVLYKLAAAEATSPGLAACNASTGSGPTSTDCVFNDVTSGNNVFTGEAGSTTDFQAGTGYDLASGLGSTNVVNLLNGWTNARSAGTTTALTIPTTFPVAHGGNVTVQIAVTSASGTPTGNVSLVADTAPNGQNGFTGVTLATFNLTGGTVSTTTNALPGGSYFVQAHYEGDGTFLPGFSAQVPVNITKENSNTQVELVLLNINTGAVSVVNTLPYGSNSGIRMNVLNSSNQPCAGSKIEIATTSGCPTGTVALTSNGNPLDGGTFTLNSLGYTEDQSENVSLSPGTYNLSATYSGDNSFTGSSPATDAITITQATTAAAAAATPSSIVSGGTVTLSAIISTQSFGRPPTGTLTFFNGSTQLGNPVTVAGSFSTAAPGFAQATASLVTTLSNLPAPVGLNRRPLNLRIYPVWITSFFIAILCLLALAALRRGLRVSAYSAVVLVLLLTGTIGGCGSSGGGGGGGGHNDTITAKYSGDANYAASQSTVTVTVQ